ncbi:MAG TPA: DNA mismatch repair protein MutS [Bryobacteraceae bacterium]|jgi:DNA mismatch repair protein MutS|nr:DNA mismatch repair protein MutS [Bryobacteraceae bacterium]
MSPDSASTPLMRQYHAIKQQVPGALLMFRLGDFYELFLDDAIVAARELEITLTARNKEKGTAIPMCGVPYHAAEGYIARLIGRGYRVAICDQLEEAGPGKKLVRREVTRIVTPGTATDAHLLRSHENNYLGAIARNGTKAGLAWVDVSTGEFRATELDLADLPGLLESIGAREVLVAAAAPLFPQPEPKRWIVTELDDWVFSFDYSDRILREHFRLHSLDGAGLEGKPAAVAAGGAVLHYLRDTQRAALDHLDPPKYFDRADAMVLDAVTVRNLELLDPIFSDGGPTLIGVLDQTATGMGGRLLRQRLLRPSLDRAEIESRLDAVSDLAKETILRAELRKQLAPVLDIERLLAKVMIGSAGPRDLLALGKSLDQTPRLAESARLASKPVSSRLSGTFARLDSVPEASGPILAALSETPPLNIGDSPTIRAGFDAELDELRDLSQNGRQYIAQIEARERQRTGIASLKIRFNNVFGYYIEISKANLHLAPADYERKQTLVNAERFTTPELKEYERKVLAADEKILEIEKRIFGEVRRTTAEHAQRIRATASAVAELDVSAALAQVGAENRYSRPQFSSGGEMSIAAGRHPVIEKLANEEAGRFIPNDLYLHDETDQIAIVTGPNMGGKSTYLRQAALIAIMAQMGSWVPADAASLPLIDRIFTRIGASDNLARGRSTFMVEMTETAVILNTATPRSFIILDEIGRGTATYDGLSLAWAVVEHISTATRAKTLFATHYHELTELAEQLEGVRNLRVAVKEAGDRIIFLRKVEPGKADRSYGIEVARLAGLPMGVIERAREVLTLHEKTEHRAVEQLSPRSEPTAVQIRLFEPNADEIRQKIRGLKIDEMRPVEALRFLEDLQREIE